MTSGKLHWKSAEGATQEFALAANETLIGRKGDANLIVAGQHVSRHHAKVVSGEGGQHIVDLGSTYGTFVNGSRVERHALQHGDRIQFGRDSTEYRYLLDSGGPIPPDTTKIVSRSIEDLGRILPSSAASDLEKISCLLDFQNQFSQVFTPENAMDQILESALKLSAAERAFIMTRKGEDFGYSAGLDGNGRRLLEAEFKTSRTVVKQVVSTGQPVIMANSIEGDLAEQQSIVAMKVRAIACLPLMGIPTEGDSVETLGILYLDSKNAMNSLSNLDERILSRIAVEAGNVLERVEMMKSIDLRKTLERDLALAEETQRNLLPRSLPQVEFLKLFASSQPTRYVGGDFYHFQEMPSREVIGVLADVSGKGVAASLLSSMLLGCMELMLGGGEPPVDAMNRLNKFLNAKSQGKFATIFLFSMPPDGKGHYISAGHNPAYLYRAAEKRIDELPSTGLVLGAFSFATFQTAPVELKQGDVMLVYSDGLTEAENTSGEMFGEERVKELVAEHAPAGGDRLHSAVLAAIQEYTQGRTQTDDITIMIAERP